MIIIWLIFPVLALSAATQRDDSNPRLGSSHRYAKATKNSKGVSSICHKTGNKKCPWMDIYPNFEAWNGHVAHGDYPGTCASSCEECYEFDTTTCQCVFVSCAPTAAPTYPPTTEAPSTEAPSPFEPITPEPTPQITPMPTKSAKLPTPFPSMNSPEPTYGPKTPAPSPLMPVPTPEPTPIGLETMEPTGPETIEPTGPETIEPTEVISTLPPSPFPS